MEAKVRTFIVSAIVAFVLTVVYTNLAYWMGEVTWLIPGVIVWNWNDFMVMLLVATGITTSLTVLLHNLLGKTKKRRKRSE